MKDIISHKIYRIHGHKKEHHHVMLFLVLYHSLIAQKAKASQFSVLFAFAHQAKASPISLFRFPISVFRLLSRFFFLLALARLCSNAGVCGNDTIQRGDEGSDFIGGLDEGVSIYQFANLMVEIVA